jgi:hypothetical protein
LVFKDHNTPDIDNFFARFGTGAPHLCMADYTDVVREGDTNISIRQYVPAVWVRETNIV